MSKQLTFILTAICFCTILGCERKAPTFIAKEARGKDAVQIYDLMKDQNQYIEYRKGDRIARAEAIKQLRIAEERERGVYRRESRWDY